MMLKQEKKVMVDDQPNNTCCMTSWLQLCHVAHEEGPSLCSAIAQTQQVTHHDGNKNKGKSTDGQICQTNGYEERQEQCQVTA